jgi:hypothetical protein
LAAWLVLVVLAATGILIAWHGSQLHRRSTTWFVQQVVPRIQARPSALAAILFLVVAGSFVVKVACYDAPAIRIKNLLFSQTLFDEALSAPPGRLSDRSLWTGPAGFVDYRKERMFQLLICSRIAGQIPASRGESQLAEAKNALPGNEFRCPAGSSDATDPSKAFDRELFQMFLVYCLIALLPLVALVPYRTPSGPGQPAPASPAPLLRFVKALAVFALVLNAFMLPFYYAKTLLPQDSYQVSVKCGHCGVKTAVELPASESGYRFFLQDRGQIVEVLEGDLYAVAVVPPTTDLLHHRIQHFLESKQKSPPPQPPGVQ